MGGLENKKISHVTVAYNLSGALEAVKLGRFVALVDLIDMSTTLEALREAGAVGLWGAAPWGKEKSFTDPIAIGRAVAQEAKAKNADVVIIAEPRVGSESARISRAEGVLRGLAAENVKAKEILPNLGAETARFTDWRNKTVVAITDAGGTVFDAVWQQQGSLTTVTIARTLKMKGNETALVGIERAFREAQGKPITFVAASSNALEDVLAAHYLAQTALVHPHFLP